MKSLVLSLLPVEDIMLLERVRLLVQYFPDDLDLGKDEHGGQIVLSCHILARAVASVFGIEFQDGYFYPFYEHGWNITCEGNVIDVYPVGILGGPILVHQTHNFASPVKHLYEPNIFFLERSSKASFKRAVLIAVEAARKVARDKKLI